MRTHTVPLGDNSLVCATTFKAMLLVTERVGDPMQIARDEALFAEAQRAGRVYEPKIPMTITNLVLILQAGNEAAGGSLSVDEVGEMVMEHGAANCLQPVGDYLASLVAGKTAEIPTGKKGKRAPAGK